MKKKFYLTIACFVLLSFEQAKGHVHFIVFGGFNSSKVITEFDNKETFFSEFKYHYNFGACFRLEMGKVFYLQPEVYFTRKGGLERSIWAGTFDSLDESLDIASVDMPIMAGFRFFDNDKFSLRLYGGPVISFLQPEDPWNEIEIRRNGRLLEHIQSSKVFSMQAGLGMDIRSFTFDVRYEYAFSPLISFETFKTKHKIIYFTLGLKLF
jgi:hypothetical protein